MTTETKAKHTPGPWKVEPYTNTMAASIHGPDGEWIGDVNAWMATYEQYEESLANARLIETAPELLEAAQDALVAIKAFHGEVGWDIYYNNAPEMKRIRAAIAKVLAEIP